MTGIDFINIEKKRIEERREELDKIYYSFEKILTSLPEGNDRPDNSSVEITPRASNKKRYELLGNS